MHAGPAPPRPGSRPWSRHRRRRARRDRRRARAPRRPGPARRSLDGATGLRRTGVAQAAALRPRRRDARATHAREHRPVIDTARTPSARARRHPSDEVEAATAHAHSIARAGAPSQRTATRSLRYFTRATSSRATPSYANADTDHATPASAAGAARLVSTRSTARTRARPAARNPGHRPGSSTASRSWTACEHALTVRTD